MKKNEKIIFAIAGVILIYGSILISKFNTTKLDQPKCEEEKIQIDFQNCVDEAEENDFESNYDATPYIEKKCMEEVELYNCK